MSTHIAAKKHHNRANYVVALGDARKAKEDGHEVNFYCGRPGCGPFVGPQCADCAGYTAANVPQAICFNRKGYEMVCGDDGKYYCGKQYAAVTKLLGLNGGRCHPSTNWQCKHCKGFARGTAEPPMVGRHNPAEPELCEPKPFKNEKSSNKDI